MTQDLAVLNGATVCTHSQTVNLSTTSGYTISGGNAVGYTDYWPYTVPYPVYPTWPSTIFYSPLVSRDKGEQAFKLAQKLMEKKLVEAKSAKQFIELMNAILEEI